MMAVPAPYVYNATVTRVIDGDTIEVDVDWGFRRHDIAVPIRILGVNAREHDEPGGPEAVANLAGLIPPGTPLVLRTTKPDKYAPRWDAAIETPTIADLASRLIADGWAAPWNGNGTKPKPPWPRKA